VKKLSQLQRMLVRTGAIVVALGALSAPALALTTYTYTAPWSYWANSWGSSNWASYAALTQGLTFEFTTSAPLISVGCGTNSYNISCQSDLATQVESWHYNGGSSFLKLGSDVADSVLTGLFLSTDANGNILNDRFYLNGPVVIPSLVNETSTLSEAHDGYDQQLLQSTYLRQYSTGMHSEPLYASLSEGMSNGRGAGQWSVSNTSDPIVSAVPEPETYALMLLGVGLIGTIARRQKAPIG
jgi:hypothetical protein